MSVTKGLATKVSASIRSRKIGSKSKKVASPLEAMPISGNIEVDDHTEATVVLSHLRQAKSQIQEALGMGYFLPIVFVSTMQADEFLRQIGWHAYLDESGTYLDGVEIAKALGVRIPSVQVKFRGQRSDKRLIDEVGLIPQREEV